MTKEEILEYVLNTPENTNRAVLSDMLDQYNSGSNNNNDENITVTTFFDSTVTFSPVQTSWGTNYEAEAHVATLPITFPAYDPDFYSTAYNHFLICITPTNEEKVIGQMLPSSDVSLMLLGWTFYALPDMDSTCEVELYSDGTLKFRAYHDWAQTPTRIQFQLVEI